MPKTLCAVLSAFAFAPAALGQSPYGSVEFRWRERALGVQPVSFGAQATPVVSPGATPFTGAAADGTSDPTNINDLRFVLILEARVTRAAGNSDLGGLGGMAFNLVSSATRSDGRFAASPVSGSADRRNSASSATSVATLPNPSGPGVVLPTGATELPGSQTNASLDRGVFAPFRRVADLGGKNQPAIGMQNLSTVGPLANNPTLENIVIGASVDPLTYVDEDSGLPGPYFGRNEYYGLNNWVPVFTTVYNVTAYSSFPWVDITAQISVNTATDSGIRGFRGFNNPQGVDSWQIDTSGVPTFRIWFFPTPGTAMSVLVFGSLAGLRRRRACRLTVEPVADGVVRRVPRDPQEYKNEAPVVRIRHRGVVHWGPGYGLLGRRAGH